ncbi:hypothetical protein F383_22188 [Gossypium arboreum]|uniref:Uncharacterized protein n=1 Tax=Gossypium arboreum TaxID=29729 RepID=A0A0B0NXS2_GOSAR|nr:hypothetical protein F383_22188 [Gossypium arboreum]
MFTGNRSKT